MYNLGIDVGTTFTAAAVSRGGAAEMVGLGDRSTAIPSVLFVGADDNVLVGTPAERRALTDPTRVLRGFKRRIGDTTPIMIEGSPWSPQALTAMLLEWVVDRVTEREGGPPSRVAVCHPANWGPYKIELLGQAVEMAAIDEVTLVSEPEAAAVHWASQERVDVGTLVAVYDLGGGTFDTAVLEKAEEGFRILGEPAGIEHLGGLDFDAAVFDHVRTQSSIDFADLDPESSAARQSIARVRSDCTAAKEALSADTSAVVPVLLPEYSGEVMLTRGEFERAIRPALTRTIDCLRRAVKTAGREPGDIDAVLLVGGSSRIPLVAGLITAELGRPVFVDAHPKHAIALGAVHALGAAHAEVAPADPEVEPETGPAPEQRADPEPRPTRPAGRRVALMVLLSLFLAAIAAVVILPGLGGSSNGDPELLWQFETNSSLSSRPLIADDTLVIGAFVTGTVHGISTETGEEVWTLQTEGGVAGDGIVADGTVYIGSIDGVFYALDPATGETEWSTPLDAELTGGALVSEGHVHVGDKNGTIWALDQATGSVQWQAETGGEINSAPAAITRDGDVSLIVGSTDGGLYIIEPATGVILERVELAGGVWFSTPLVVDNDDGSQAIWVGTSSADGGHLNRVELASLEVRTFTTAAGVGTDPAVTGTGLIIAGNDRGELFAVDPVTLGEVWREGFADGTQIKGSPAVFGDQVFFGTHGRELISVDSATGVEQWSFAGEQIFGLSAPVVVGERLYVGNDSGKVSAFDLAP